MVCGNLEVVLPGSGGKSVMVVSHMRRTLSQFYSEVNLKIIKHDTFRKLPPPHFSP